MYLYVTKIFKKFQAYKSRERNEWHWVVGSWTWHRNKGGGVEVGKWNKNYQKKNNICKSYPLRYFLKATLTEYNWKLLSILQLILWVGLGPAEMYTAFLSPASYYFLTNSTEPKASIFCLYTSFPYHKQHFVYLLHFPILCELFFKFW